MAEWSDENDVLQDLMAMSDFVDDGTAIEINQNIWMKEEDSLDGELGPCKSEPRLCLSTETPGPSTCGTLDRVRDEVQEAMSKAGIVMEDECVFMQPPSARRQTASSTPSAPQFPISPPSPLTSPSPSPAALDPFAFPAPAAAAAAAVPAAASLKKKKKKFTPLIEPNGFFTPHREQWTPMAQVEEFSVKRMEFPTLGK